MATRSITIAASPEDVFAVLAHGRDYAQWVVGAKEIRAVDAGWPAPGSRIHHTVGIGPFTIDDVTEVVEVAAPHRLVLLAKVRPAGQARVTLELRAVSDGTEVTMHEKPVKGFARFVPAPLREPALHARNEASLAQLRRVVEERLGGGQAS